jgi:hypothetical protein
MQVNDIYGDAAGYELIFFVTELSVYCIDIELTQGFPVRDGVMRFYRREYEAWINNGTISKLTPTIKNEIIDK